MHILWDQGWIKGAQNRSNLAIFDPPPITLVRARAYNDCAKDAVLLKTASKWLQAGPPKWTHFGGLQMTRIHTGTCYMSISLHPRYVRICVNIYPQNGHHFGGRASGPRIRTPDPGFEPIWGDFWTLTDDAPRNDPKLDPIWGVFRGVIIYGYC